jgi:hypothetical protein
MLLLPERRKTPLVPRHGWTATGAFVQNASPQPGEVSRSVRENAQAVFWRSWGPKGSGPGTLTSSPFTAPRVISVPFVGYPGEAGIELYLECLATRERRTIATGNAHENWIERTMRISPQWCPSQIRLVAKSTSQRSYIGVGTPVRSSRLSWLKESVFVLTALHAGAWTVIVAPGLVLLRLARVNHRYVSLQAAIPVTFAIGYASFFAMYYARVSAELIILAFTSVCAVALAYRGRAWWKQYRHELNTQAFRLAFAVSVVYVFFVYSADQGIGTWASTYRFAPAIWSSDAQLPQMVAEGVYRQVPMKDLIGGGWHVSDRPPLLSGLMLLARPAWRVLFAIGDNQRLAFLFYQVLGLVACTLWVVPAWMLLARVLRSARDATLGVLMIGTTGFIVFNSVYIWPKMLAGALALGSYLVLAKAIRNQGSARPYYFLAGGLAGFALLSHGGVVFGLVPLFAQPLLRPTRHRVMGLAVAGTAAILVLAPWLLWQRFEDPPGNALIKFALAGTWGMGEETKSVWVTVRDVHTTLTFADWLSMRRDSLLTLVGAYHPPLVAWYWTQQMDLAGRLRAFDFLYLLPALGAANLGWITFVFLPNRFVTSRESARQESVRWVGLGVSGVALASLVNFSVNINHCQSYQSILLLLLGLYAALLSGPSWLRWTAVAANFAYFCVVWIWSPLAVTAVRPEVAMGGAVGVLSLVLCLVRNEPSSVSTVPVAGS